MSISPSFLAIDQGTTSSRALVFNAHGQVQTLAQQEFQQYYPKEGWVEHNPEEIWDTVFATTKEVLTKHGAVSAIGITNQRESTIVWEKATGKPIYPAIVWQDRRTADTCAAFKAQGMEAHVTAKTGLLLDPYFSATKLAWILENVPGAREKAGKGALAFGTVDSFLLWRMTGGKVHATDATNASRTMLYNIHTQQWDEELLKLFGIPAAMLPEVKDSAADFGITDKSLFGQSIPIAAIAGDQQAAAIGQCCFHPGMMKSTYGTGCFVLLNTGERAAVSTQKLLTTIAYRLNGKATYALEGSIFIAGAAVQWLRDMLGFLETSAEAETLASSLASNKGVYLVPAFTGLGAPWWQPQARGALFGMTRDTGKAEIVRAALEAVAYQTSDLIAAMAKDGIQTSTLRVDGGMAKNNWLMQFLADILSVTVTRPVITETTALGAAYLAGLHIGTYSSLDDIAQHWQKDTQFIPTFSKEMRQDLLAHWHKAVQGTLGFQP